MNLNLEIDESIAKSLDEAAAIKGWTRETAIKAAIDEWIAYQPKIAACLEMLKQWPGEPDFPRFEADRPGPEALPPDPFEGLCV